MRTILAALVCLVASHGFAQAQAVAPGDRAAIQQVISAQMEAFKRDDGAAALRFAAPSIQAKFGDGAHFLAMARIGYMAVVRPRSVTFGDLTPEDGGKLQQKVELVGPSGEGALALYDMEHEADGSWRIAGCVLTKSERLDI